MNQQANNIQEQYNQAKQKVNKLKLQLYKLNSQLEDIQEYNKKHWFNRLLTNFFSKETIIKYILIMLILGIISGLITNTITNILIPNHHIFLNGCLNGLICCKLSFKISKTFRFFKMKKETLNNFIQDINEQKETITQELQKTKIKEMKLSALYTEQQNNQKLPTHIKPINHEFDESKPNIKAKK